jgi:hypothetical protein
LRGDNTDDIRFVAGRTYVRAVSESSLIGVAAVKLLFPLIGPVG